MKLGDVAVGAHRRGIRGIALGSVHNVWVVGQNGGIAITSDGGNTWTAQFSNTFADLRDIAFIDANTGWAVGTAGTVLRTSDGGGTNMPAPHDA